jgi:pyruvate decarboxylase
VIRKLISSVGQIKLASRSNPVIPAHPLPKDFEETSIVQSWIWKRLGQFTRPNDIIIAESGTAQFGFSDASFPENTTFVTQVYYGSIGYSVGCCLGAGLAQRELEIKKNTPAGRLILVVGDGSLQLTVQEIGTMIKANLSPIM